jgi:oxygen-dependent protoporphyrinogen oxidase
VTAIAVIGGGITGLSAAYELATIAPPQARLLLFEASGRLGGKVRTDAVDGVLTEAGPDSFLVREPWARELCDKLGLGDDLVAPAVFGAAILHRGRLRRLPEGFAYGMPSRPLGALRTGLLSPLGALRAAGDLFLPGPLRGPDVSIGDFVRRRFGRQVLERLVDPLLAGTRAGTPDGLGLAAAAPPIDALARRHRSVIAGLHAARRAGELESGPPPFLGIRGGMQRLTDELSRALASRVDTRTNAAVASVKATADGFSLTTAAQETLTAAGIVIAVPAFAASPLLGELDAGAARELRAIEHASVAVVTLVYSPGSFETLRGISGILVPSSEGRTIAAATFFDTKWPHAAPSDGRRIVRCVIGRSGTHPALELADDALAARAHADLRDALGIVAEPIGSLVVRWERGLAQYSVGHLERISRVERALSRHGAVALPGSGYRGSGLPDCIRQGRDAARRVLGALEPVR